MKPLETLKTAITNSLRSKLRTTLTILAIFVGAFTLTITNGLGTGISNYIDTQTAAVGSSNSFTIGKTDTSSNAGSGPKKYDPNTKTVAAGGRPGSTVQTLSQADLDKVAAVPGITSVTPVSRLSPDYIQGNNQDRYQVTVSPLAGANPQLTAGAALDDNAGPQLILPASYSTPLGFSDDNGAVGQDAIIGITDATADDAYHHCPHHRRRTKCPSGRRRRVHQQILVHCACRRPKHRRPCCGENHLDRRDGDVRRVLAGSDRRYEKPADCGRLHRPKPG